MENKKLNVKRCTVEEIQKCDHPLSDKKWDGDFVCSVIRPIDCPKLLCDGEPCLAGAVVDTNSEQVEFPCSGCKKTTLQEREVNRLKLKSSLEEIL